MMGFIRQNLWAEREGCGLLFAPLGSQQSTLCTALSLSSTQGVLSARNTNTHTDGSPKCQGRIYSMEHGICQRSFPDKRQRFTYLVASGKRTFGNYFFNHKDLSDIPIKRFGWRTWNSKERVGLYFTLVVILILSCAHLLKSSKIKRGTPSTKRCSWFSPEWPFSSSTANTHSSF